MTVQKTTAQELWETCSIGSCQRHRQCVYMPCRQVGAEIGCLALRVAHNVPIAHSDEQKLIDAGAAERVTIIRLTRRGRQIANSSPADSA